MTRAEIDADRRRQIALHEQHEKARRARVAAEVAALAKERPDAPPLAKEPKIGKLYLRKTGWPERLCDRHSEPLCRRCMNPRDRWRKMRELGVAPAKGQGVNPLPPLPTRSQRRSR